MVGLPRGQSGQTCENRFRSKVASGHRLLATFACAERTAARITFTSRSRRPAPRLARTSIGRHLENDGRGSQAKRACRRVRGFPSALPTVILPTVILSTGRLVGHGDTGDRSARPPVFLHRRVRESRRADPSPTAGHLSRPLAVAAALPALLAVLLGSLHQFGLNRALSVCR